jgi:alpha-galactosidase
MAPGIRDILINKEVIAVDQDPLGLQGRRVRDDGDLEVWAKQLVDGSRAVALLNRGGTEKRMTVNWTDLGYPAHVQARVRDMWAGQDHVIAKESFSASVPSHGVVMLKIKP